MRRRKAKSQPNSDSFRGVGIPLRTRFFRNLYSVAVGVTADGATLRLHDAERNPALPSGATVQREAPRASDGVTPPDRRKRTSHRRFHDSPSPPPRLYTTNNRLFSTLSSHPLRRVIVGCHPSAKITSLPRPGRCRLRDGGVFSLSA